MRARIRKGACRLQLPPASKLERSTAETDAMSTEPLPAGLNILPQVLCLRGDLVTRRRELHAKAQVRQCSGI